MQNTIQGNLKTWDSEHHWAHDGDEWDGQARYCGVPYDEWKSSLIETFLKPRLGQKVNVVEIAPGHGRWTDHIVSNCKSLTVFDLSPNCVEFCQERFKDYKHLSCVVTDGSSLPGLADNSVDFIWSFDSFVHMPADVILSYLQEAARVLQPGGAITIHHAGRRHSTLSLGFLKKLGNPGRELYKLISLPDRKDDDGWRSDISPELVQSLASNANLQIQSQVQSWGDHDKYGVRRYGDWITTLTKAGG